MTTKLINPQLAALFREGEVVGSKVSLLSLPTYDPTASCRFFCINPLKQAGKLELENIAEYRNILVEMDTGSIEEQWKHIEGSKLPWTTCVYSGGKSLHFIISVEDGLGTLEFYNKIALIICKALGADTSTINPNRLSRLAGSVREDTGLEQELVEVRKSIRFADLLNWRYIEAPLKLRKAMDKIDDELTAKWFNQQLAAKTPVDEANSSTTMPPVYVAMLREGALHPETTSRHQSLVKFAVWLKEHWHEPENIPCILEEASVSLGIDGRGDVEGIMKWLNK